MLFSLHVQLHQQTFFLFVKCEQKFYILQTINQRWQQALMLMERGAYLFGHITPQNPAQTGHAACTGLMTRVLIASENITRVFAHAQNVLPPNVYAVLMDRTAAVVRVSGYPEPYPLPPTLSFNFPTLNARTV
jgi:hypothetical protein